MKQHQQQPQQLQRHVCTMLSARTTATKTTTAISAAQLLMLITATTLLFASTSASTTATILPKAATHATPTAAIVAEAPIIGATSLAAVVAAQGVMSTGRSSSSGRNGDEIIAARSANLLLEDMQQPGHMVNLTRHHDGDVFRTSGVTNCNADTCVGLSSGTAGLVHMGGSMHDRFSAVGSLAGGGAVGHLDGRLGVKRSKPSAAVVGSSCDCRCLPYLSTYREDLGICVDDIHECTLSPFVSGSSSEKIPFVFLPLRGQIIYPSREISFPDIRTPVCAVTGAQYLTTNGWTDLRNPIDTDYPFRMFRDEGRTFLQWLGEPDLRQKMQGRLIVVHLVCRDMMLTLNATAAAAAAAAAKEHFRPPKNVFSPCVAFRVNGSPVKYFHNVSEVLFQSEPTTTLASTSDGMSTKEYVVIGVCSLLLGLIYVSSVFLYLHMKKRKNRDQSHMRSSLDDLANEINYPKNDQVTFGAPFNRSGSIYSVASMTNSNEPRSRASISSAVGVHMKEEMGIVKNNPLLQHFPQLSEHHSGFASDISNSNSECETDGGYHDKLKQMQTAALVHPASAGMTAAMGQSSPGSASRHSSESPVERANSPTQESECLPEENVSIVEDMMTEEKMEQMRQMVNGTIRKKLFFNPAYFEPHLLAQPPPAAVEFLTKIREVIAIAKYKMATKRYQPSLVVIPEEGAMRSTTPSLYSSQLQMSGTDGCRGCATNRCTGHAKNCGDKRNSIEKWLQTVSQTDADKAGNSNGSENGNQQQQKQSSADTQRSERRQSPPAHNESGTSPTHREITPPKQRPPPPPPKPVHNNSSPPRAHVIEIRHNSAAYENTSNIQHHNSAGGNSTTITVNNRNFDAFAALSTAANMYGFAEMGGEIYNNPKFILHDSPVASQRSQSSSHRSKTSRKRLDVLDQYAAASTPTSLTSADREHYEMLRNMKQLPDMAYDTITRDYTATLPSSNGSYHLDIPTPDYDSTMEKKIKDIYCNSTVLSSVPSVPTPDYSTLSKKSLRQCQPDSPIYRRKSPQYLIVDYETDSSERLNAAKRKSSQSSSSPSSDVSSQLSPSLSTALPLEEELEISHTVYDKVNGFRKDGNVKKKIIAKPENNASKQKEIEARIKYDTPFRGSMTIEVEHEPPSDLELSTDSDQYEPDTLDRKPKKHSFCDVNAWSEHMQKAQHFVNSPADAQNDVHASYQSLENMNSLPSLAKQAAKLKQEQVQSQSPLNYMLAHCARTPSESSVYVKHIVNECSHMRNAEHRHSSFDNLRDIYQSKLYRQNSQSSQGSSHSRAQNEETPNAQVYNDKGRLLTLEAKHSRRQRLMETQVIPPEIETVVVENKTTIKIKTPNLSRTQTAITKPNSSSQVTCESQRGYVASSSQLACEGQRSYAASPSNNTSSMRSNVLNNSKGFYDLTKNLKGWNTSNSQTPVSSLTTSGRGTPAAKQKLRSPPTPPPPPPPSSASTTLNSHRSNNSSKQQFRLHQQQPVSHHYQNQSLQFSTHQTATCTEEETASNHSESTEITRVSDTQANSEFDCSCNNTLDSEVHKPEPIERELSVKGDTSEISKSRRSSINKRDNNDNATKSRRNSVNKRETTNTNETTKSRRNSTNSVNKEDITNESTQSRRNSLSNQLESCKSELPQSPQAIKKLADKHDYGAMYNSQYNGLRNDYSLNKYLNRRKSQDHLEEDQLNINNDAKLESNNNSKNVELDASKLDVISISSRSNRSSSRLSDRTKEMYRNAGVPVGIAYPQRSTANSSTTSTTNVQTVYRCEIEPVQLTHGMQIAMGLKDRAKKAKDLKNAWKKFVSMAASKFSPTTSPAPPFEKKTAATFLESLERDEGISSLIDEHPQVATPKSSYSAPASQNYYEQRFGTARLQELDSGYMSADSSEVYKRSFYDRYNFRMMSGRDRVIRVDTIADNSDSGSTLTERHKTANGVPVGELRKNNMLDSNRFEDLEHMGEPAAIEHARCEQQPDDVSDADSDRTLTRVHDRRRSRSARTGTMNLYSSEDEQGNSPSYGSSETDGETNVEDMWESGAESIETHSVLYKKVRKN